MLERLNPGMIVELDDPVMGGRKLGLVDETGLGYFDLIAEDELPKPLHSELNPVERGNINSWASKLPDGAYEEFVEVWNALTSKNLDLLTIVRALRWGLDNNTLDADLIERMGQAETEKITKGRQQVATSMAG